MPENDQSRAREPLGLDDVSFTAVEGRVRAAVHGVAATDPDPSDPYRGLYISDDLALRLTEGEATDRTIDDRLATVAQRLALTELETAVLACIAAPQLDPRYARLIAYLHDDVTRKAPSPRLVARLLGAPDHTATVLETLAHDAPLRRLGAVTLLPADDGTPVADRALAVADHLAAFLVGAALDDAGATPWRLVRHTPDGPEASGARAEAGRMLRALVQAGGSVPIVVAGVDAADFVASMLGRDALVGDAMQLPDAAVRHAGVLRATLHGAQLCIDRLDEIAPEHRPALAAALRSLETPPLVLARKSAAVSTALGDVTTLLVEVPEPTFGERRAAWQHHTGVSDATEVAAKFRLSLGQIAEAADVARTVAHGRGEPLPSADDLDLGAREASSSQLGELATRIDPRHRWADLILPTRELDHLRSIAAHLRQRDRVLHEWGYGDTITRGHGLKALFAGESGTGKTMAAQVIAAELGLQLYRVDLATVVSKYIGETEKNLDRIFNAAEGSNAIIFFDEADALFGKRSDVGDAHDRYANIEVSYLLQKMEGYEGAVVLATNYQRNIDDAFARRLDYVITFPFPEVEDRERIWAKLLPERAPLADDVDLHFLADRFKLAGGAIRNCALAAGYLASEEGDEIRMAHLVRAVAMEYGKLGRLTIEADFKQYHAELG